ncbi:hypothetical protein KHP60_11305 [Microvirga sp. 3-52]|jgi:hypothetical protein|uniref:hypothetical protein n=1 Tax=Microvirga sp. 3-52 TaxID=2792425 RepID=UPI001ACF4DB8|nr:hypothetical protein [Microvirga sp. 3-52]MBO1905114.1 hypothetical protein [Microvirga sp. 3-52]MBS7452919.1 hypothetical protein [Microvirga sp. 3-52]
MKIRSLSAALALGLGLTATVEAQAWFAEIDDERPPPNGANGLSANGMTINGFARREGAGTVQIRTIVLKDGNRVHLK